MQPEAFRQYLRNKVISASTGQPLAERTVEKYISDIVDIESYCRQNLDTLSINALSNLILDLDRHMPLLSPKSVKNYRSPANHYLRFRKQSS